MGGRDYVDYIVIEKALLNNRGREYNFGLHWDLSGW